MTTLENPEQTRPATPVGVSIIGWILFLLGSFGVLLVVTRVATVGEWTAWNVFTVAMRLLLFVVPGWGLLSGRTWGWRSAGTLFVTGLLIWVLLGLMVHVPALGNPGLTVPSGLIAWAVGFAAVVVAAQLGGLLYLYRPHVLDFFGLGDHRRRTLLLMQAAPALILMLFYLLAVEKPAIMQAESNLPRLQRIGEARSIDASDLEFALGHLQDGDVEERVHAAWALGQTGHAGAVDELLAAARDDADSNVRINALAAIGEIGGELPDDDVGAMLADPDEQIRASVVRTLTKLEVRDSAPLIADLLTDESSAVRTIAADALGLLGDGSSVEALHVATDDASEEVRSRVAYALGRLGQARSIPSLSRLLRDNRWEVRANAAQALGMIGDSSARRVLEDASRDRNEVVVASAERALGRLR